MSLPFRDRVPRKATIFLAVGRAIYRARWLIFPFAPQEFGHDLHPRRVPTTTLGEAERTGSGSFSVRFVWPLEFHINHLGLISERLYYPLTEDMAISVHGADRG